MIATATPYANMVIDHGADLYHALDEKSGTVAKALVGFDGEYMGGVTLGVPGPDGVSRAAAFNGSSATHVRISNTDNRLQIGVEVTDEFWFRVVTWRQYDSLHGWSGNFWDVRMDSVNYARNHAPAGPNNTMAYADANLADIFSSNGIWHHYARRIRMSDAPSPTFSIMIDGIEVASGANLSAMLAGPPNFSGYANLYFGSTGGRNAICELCKVARYPLLLSDEQIAQHYATGLDPKAHETVYKHFIMLNNDLFPLHTRDTLRLGGVLQVPPPMQPRSTAVLGNSVKGDWVGNYGEDGYLLCAWDGGSDLVALPDGITYTSTFARHVWQANENLPKNVESPDETIRKASCWYNNGTAVFSFARRYKGAFWVYMLDWEAAGRKQYIALNGDTLEVPSLIEGCWAGWPIDISIGETLTLTATSFGASNAVFSMIAFGGPLELPLKPTLDSVPGLLARYKASDFVTQTNATVVSEWKDSSTNNRHAVAVRPAVWDATQQAVRFSNTELTVSNFPLDSTTTMFAVIAQGPSPSTIVYELGPNSNNAHGGYLVAGRNSTFSIHGIGGRSNYDADAAWMGDPNEFQLVMLWCEGLHATHRLERNGVVVPIVSVGGSYAADPGETPGTANLNIGCRAGGVAPFAGWVKELMFFDHPLTPEEIRTVHNFVASEYSLEIEL